MRSGTAKPNTTHSRTPAALGSFSERRRSTETHCACERPRTDDCWMGSACLAIYEKSPRPPPLGSVCLRPVFPGGPRPQVARFTKVTETAASRERSPESNFVWRPLPLETHFLWGRLPLEVVYRHFYRQFYRQFYREFYREFYGEIWALFSRGIPFKSLTILPRILLTILLTILLRILLTILLRILLRILLTPAPRPTSWGTENANLIT